MPLTELPNRAPPDLLTNGRNWEWLRNTILDHGDLDLAGSIVNADVNASAAIAASKLAIASQNTWHPNAGLGNASSTAPGADTAYFALIKIPPNTPALTGITYYVGSTSNGNARAALYDSTGARVANRTSASAQTGINTVHPVPFDATYTPPVAGGYLFACLILSSGTGTWFRATPLAPSGTVAGPGSGATPTSITPPTATIATAPMMTTY